MSSETPTLSGPEAGATAPSIRWSGLTDIGRYRPNNEDSFLAMKLNGHEVHYLGKA